MTTGELIRKFRKEAGLTQKELGARSGIAEPTIRKYESNRLNPKIETIQKIASALKVSPAQLSPKSIQGKYFYTLPEDQQTEILKAVGNDTLYAEIAAAYLALPPDKQEMIQRMMDDAIKVADEERRDQSDNE